MDKRIQRNIRAVIYIKDICTITGRKFGTARNLYRTIQRSCKKRRDQFITLQEFCSHTGLQESLVQEYLKY